MNPTEVIKTLNDIGICKDPNTGEYDLDRFPPERTVWAPKDETYAKICSLPNGAYVWQTCVSSDMFSFFDRMTLLDYQPARMVITPNGCKTVIEFDDTRLREHPLVKALINMYEMALAQTKTAASTVTVATWLDARYIKTNNMADYIEEAELLDAYQADTCVRTMTVMNFRREMDNAHGSNKRMLRHDDRIIYINLVRREDSEDSEEEEPVPLNAVNDGKQERARLLKNAAVRRYRDKKKLAERQSTRVVNETPAPQPATDAGKGKKQKIPAALKKLVWNKHIGGHAGEAKCMCCRVTTISQVSFNCGHVVAEKNGGKLELPNLRPICQNCNSSMGTRNMDEFIDLYKLHD